MRKRISRLLVLVSLLITACQGAEKITAENTPVSAAKITAETNLTETVEITPTLAVEEKDGAAIEPSDGPNSDCTLVSSLPEPSPEYADVFSIQEDDWVLGPKDAAVTLIEYGDFQ